MDGVYFGFVLFLLLLVFASILSRTLVDDEVAKRLPANRQASLRSAVAWTVVAAVCLVPSLAAIIVFVAGGGLAAGDPFDHPVRATLALCVMAIGLVGMCTAVRLVFVASGQDPVE